MENKYFAVMRERDLGAHERKLMHAQLDSDKKVIQGHEDRKKTFEYALVSHKHLLIATNLILINYQTNFTASTAEAEGKRVELLDTLDKIEKEKQRLQISLDGETKKIAEVRPLLQVFLLYR